MFDTLKLHIKFVKVGSCIRSGNIGFTSLTYDKILPMEEEWIKRKENGKCHIPEILKYFSLKHHVSSPALLSPQYNVDASRFSSADIFALARKPYIFCWSKTYGCCSGVTYIINGLWFKLLISPYLNQSLNYYWNLTGLGQIISEYIIKWWNNIANMQAMQTSPYQ